MMVCDWTMFSETVRDKKESLPSCHTQNVQQNEHKDDFTL